MNSTILITVTVFDDRAIMAWSLLTGEYVSPIQHIGRVSEKTWADMLSSIAPEFDRVRMHVTDRRFAQEGGR